MRTLPKWKVSMSDGCSVPKIFRDLLPVESQAWVEVCYKHDEAYYYGGTMRDKAIADAEALVGWLRAQTDLKEMKQIYTALEYYKAVKLGGGPEFRKPGVSWAFGGSYFQYGEKAVPEDDKQ